MLIIVQAGGWLHVDYFSTFVCLKILLIAELADLANKNAECPIKYEFQINGE